jgi:mevalonate kinase
LGVVILGEHLVVRGAGALILAVAVAAMTAATIALGRDSVPSDQSDKTSALAEMPR